MVKVGKDWVDAYFAYGVDVLNRRLFLLGTIEEENVTRLIQGLYLMDAVAGSDTKKITLVVNSYGGSVYDALALYDAMRTVKAPIETVAIGKCMSAATLIISAGDTRWATPNCSFMIHDISSWEEEKKVSTMMVELKHSEHLRQRFIQLLEKHTKLSKTKIKQFCGDRADHYFDAETAVEYGFIDNLWSEKD